MVSGYIRVSLMAELYELVLHFNRVILRLILWHKINLVAILRVDFSENPRVICYKDL